jgi:hypothetical protein
MIPDLKNNMDVMASFHTIKHMKALGKKRETGSPKSTAHTDSPKVARCIPNTLMISVIV